MCVTERRNISQERYSIREVPVKRGACEERCLRREMLLRVRDRECVEVKGCAEIRGAQGV